jgi:hypothetical protein
VNVEALQTSEGGRPGPALGECSTAGFLGITITQVSILLAERNKTVDNATFKILG